LHFFHRASDKRRFRHFLFKESAIIQLAIGEAYLEQEVVAMAEIDAGQLATGEVYVLYAGVVELDQGEVAIFKYTVDKAAIGKVGFREVAVGKRAVLIFLLEDRLFRKVDLVEGLMFVWARGHDKRIIYKDRQLRGLRIIIF
jgi:hypothetical protein